jgi:hypothetical protein
MPFVAGQEAYQRIHDNLKREASEANRSISVANDAIQNANRTGRTSELNSAYELFWKASVAYVAGDYQTSTSLAAQAKQIADSSTKPSTVTSVTTELTRPPQQQVVLQTLQSLVSRLPAWYWTFLSVIVFVVGGVLLLRRRKILTKSVPSA